jgi:site-specific DNA-methyltransferase (adenine-specific)
MLKSETFNMDCLDYMKKCKDKQFSLLFTDPPYGDTGTGEYSKKETGRFGPMFEKYQADLKPQPRVQHATGGATSHTFYKHGDECAHWDVAPSQEWWDEAWRISDYLAVWGGNYFHLPPSRNFIIWLKPVPEDFSLAQMEFCWINIPGNSRIIRARPQDKYRFHATQKPVATFLKPLEWNIKRIDKEKGMIDPFMGSGTSRIAAWDMGINYVGIELNEVYFQKQEARFAEHTAKGNLYDGAVKVAESEEGLF